MRGLVLLLGLVACTSSAAPPATDATTFVAPDSGLFFDAQVFGRDATLTVDAGPFVCTSTCTLGSVCSCLDTPPVDCGCHPRGGYLDPCDPQVPASCRWPNECALAKKVDGLLYMCSDGREGTPCAPAQDSCNTSRGCICAQTPIGLGCSCQGLAGANPMACDPTQPQPCVEGRCVHLPVDTGGIYICSSGLALEPCDPDQPYCETSLGCTCPLVDGRASCRCSEPGSLSGDACDLRVEASCAPPLECAPVAGELPGQFSTECRGTGSSDGGVDPLSCDPSVPLCPPGYECREVQPGRFRCRATT